MRAATRVRAWLPALAGLVGSALPGAAEDTLYAKVAGFDIQRPRTGPADGFGCRMLRSTLEASDGNAGKAVIVAPKPGGIALSVAYERWAWKAGQPPKPRYRLEGAGPAQEIAPVPGELVADSYALGALFPSSLAPRVQAAARVVIEAGGTTIAFDLTGIRQAYDAVLRCNRDEAAVPAPSPSAGAGGASPPAVGASPSIATTPAAGPSLSAEMPPRPVAPAAPAPDKARPAEARLVAYLGGRGLQDHIDRCDVATTSRQRATLDAKVAALRQEMREVEDAVGIALAEEAGKPCPDARDTLPRDALDLYLRTTPEEFAAGWDDKAGGALAWRAGQILAAVQPTGPTKARLATFLYGLVLQDLIEQCDIVTTAKQRAGLAAKLDGFRAEMAAQEPELQTQKGAVTTCPAPDALAEFQTAMPLFLERSPEDFAAEMDRRSAARTLAQASQPQASDPDLSARKPEAPPARQVEAPPARQVEAPPARQVEAPPADASSTPRHEATLDCRHVALPQKPAQLRENLAALFSRELPGFGIEEFVDIDGYAVHNFGPIPRQGGDPSGSVQVSEIGKKLEGVSVGAPVESGEWRRAMLLVAGYVIRVLDPTQDPEAITRTLTPHITPRTGAGEDRIVFGPVALYFVAGPEGELVILFAKASGDNC